MWQENKDSSGGVFWFNAQTGEVTTNKPDELKTEEERLGITTDPDGDDDDAMDDQGESGEGKSGEGKSRNGRSGNSK